MEFLVHLSTGSDPTFPIKRRLLPPTTNSQPTLLNFGVPQGFVLGPILFILYTKPLTTLIRRHSISNQSFADDTQLHDSCRPDQIDTSVQGMQDCISDVKTWISSNKLKLNDDKTVSTHCLEQNLSPKPSSSFHSYRKHWYFVFLAGRKSGSNSLIICSWRSMLPASVDLTT